MASALSQEEVLDFLCQGGGKVANAALLGHFKLFLRDPRAPAEQLLRRRESFKRYVNSVAVVKPEGAVKYVVLRSRYRDLLGEDLSQAPAPDHREGDQVVPQGAQVRDVVHSNGFSDQRESAAALHQEQQGVVLISDLLLEEKTWASYKEPYSHDQKCHQASQWTSAASSCITSSPASNTSSPQNNASNLHRSPSMDYNNSSPLVIRTSPPSGKSCHHPINVYPLSSKISLPASNTISPQNNASSLHRSPSMDYGNSSPPVIRTSPSSDKSYHQPISVFLASSRTSSPGSNTSSSQKNACSLHRNPSMEHSNSSSPVMRNSPTSGKFYQQPINTYLAASRTSSPASNTSAQNNPSYLHRSPSMEYSNSSPPVIRTSPPSDKSYHQPISTYLASPRTSSPASNTSSPQNNRSSLHRHASMEYCNSNPLVPRTSPPSDKSYQQQPMTTYLTSLSPSKDSSPSNQSNSSINHPHRNQSSLSSSTGSIDIPEMPSHVPAGHFRVPPVGQKKTKSANSAFVNATSRDQDRQEHGCYACTELQSSNYYLNSTFTPEERTDYSEHLQDGQQIPTFYSELPPSAPSARYIDSPHPSPSLAFPHKSSMAPSDVHLEDYHPVSRSPTPPLPLYDIHDMWMCKMPVFKSIRCQLSLQDMEDFVDQESYGSEGSDSGEGADCETEHNIDEDPSSDSNNDKYVHYIEQKCENTRRCPPSRKFLSLNEQYGKLKSVAPVDVVATLAECGLESARPASTTTPCSNSPYNSKSFLTDQAPILFALAKNPPRHKMSSHMQEAMSSSDEELIERDLKKRRRPSRAKRPSNSVLVPPQPDVDLLLTVKPVSSNHFITYDTKDQKSLYAQYEPKVSMDFDLKKAFAYKSSTVVPLDSMEHDWSVKLASGSWLQVYGLFIEDPSLALRKDFISGFTAFHWFAKHGATDMFHKFVAGAKKAGIQLDANIKSNGGYTALHIAAIHGHHKLAAMLVEKLNVNVKLRDNSGKRAWQYLSCNTSGEVWQLLGAPKGKTIFASRALNIINSISTQNKSSQISRKTSLAAFLKPQHQKWKANNRPVLRERETYSD